MKKRKTSNKTGLWLQKYYIKAETIFINIPQSRETLRSGGLCGAGWEGGVKFEYPYKGNNSTIGLVLYSDDLVGKVLVSKDISLFITKDFSYEVFRLSTNGDLELVKLDFNQLLK